MSKLIKRSLVATALAGAMAVSGTAISADTLTDVQKASTAIHKDAAKSQTKVDGYVDQTQDLLEDYRTTLDEIENQKVYNDHLSRLVTDQESVIGSLQEQIDSIDKTAKGVVPLLYKMIDVLEKFIALDIPINMEERQARVEKLREVMSMSNVTVSEQFRLVIEAYMVENEYGTKIRAYEGKLPYDGTEISVDFFHLGRVSLVAQSLDGKDVWAWDNNSRAWVKLGDEYLNPVNTAIRMAKKLVPSDIVKLPIPAAGTAK